VAPLKAASPASSSPPPFAAACPEPRSPRTAAFGAVSYRFPLPPRRGTAAGGSAPERLAPRRRIPAIAKAHPEAWSSRTTAFGSVLSLPLGGAVPERTAPRHRRTLGHHRTAAPLSSGQPRAGARAWSARTTASGSNRPRRTPFRFALQLRRSQHERFQSPPRDSKLRRTRISKDVTRTRERAARNPDTGARGKTMA
jgi:hypothetical protein